MWKVTAVLCLVRDRLNCINTQYLPKINHDVGILVILLDNGMMFGTKTPV